MKTLLKREASRHVSAASPATQRFADKRPEAIAQRRQQQLIEGTAQTAQLQAAQGGIVQREGEDEMDFENIQGRARSNAVVERPASAAVPGRIDTSKMQALLAGGGASPLNAAAVAQVPEDGILDKVKRKVLGDKRSPAEKAQAMAAASARKNVADRAKANQVGLLGNTVARYLPGVDHQQALAAAAGQKGIAHENADAHRKINQSLALKGGGMAMSGVASAASLIPVDPLSQGLIKSAVKVGGAGLSHAGAAREGLSGGLLSEQAAARAHGLMTMNLAAEGVARTENAKLGKQQAKADGVKALIPGSGMLGAVGVDDAVAKAAPAVLGQIAKRVVPEPSKQQRAVVKGLQADAQVNKERLGNQSLHGTSKSLSPAENARIKQQQAVAKETQASMFAALGGRKAALDKLRHVEPGAASTPAAPVAESELERALRLRREKQG
ncbi:MAG: hypothetical protein ACO1PZ_05555 [Gammaproteobacteria bacterium]